MPRFFWRELGRPKARCGAGVPRRGGAYFSFPSLRGDGAPSGATVFSFAAPLSRGTRAPLGAPPGHACAVRAYLVAIFVPGAVLPGADGELFAPLIQAAFAALRPRRVQPFKAAPRSGSGRRPEASRARGYEPRPRAPPLPPFQQRPAGTPLGGEGKRNICLGRGNVKRKNEGSKDGVRISAQRRYAEKHRSASANAPEQARQLLGSHRP